MTRTETRADIRERHRQAHADALDGVTMAAWIDGQSVATAETVATRDPVVDLPITEIPICDASMVDRAVDAAQAAFKSHWRDTTPPERSRRLFEWIDALDAHREELATLECLDTGKPRSHARGEIDGAIETLEYYAAITRAQQGEQIPAQADLHMYTRTEPFGVVGQITPWNFPAWAAAWKLGPALAAGNSTLLKPSANAPLTTIRMAQLASDVVPDGVINVVTGTGATTGDAVVSHPDVRKVSFTGSGDVGSQIMQAVAERAAPVTLELGGKSPFLVFPDADIETAVQAAAAGIYYSTGEICDAFSRVLVHEDRHDEFVQRFVDISESHVLGDPLDDETTMGPLTTEAQFDTVSGYVDIGQREGATLATGGGPPEAPALADGHYFEPTVFTDVDNDMRIAREEIFGPVQTIQSFRSYDEAIDLANETKYGLAAGIATESTDIAHAAAADLEAGIVYVNAYGPIRPEGPYGGFKQSGVGRDLGEAALDHYRQPKTVYVNLDEPSL